MKHLKSTLLALLAGFLVTGTAMADEFAHSAPAVQGYDVVSYQTDKRPIRGNGHFITTYNGATYMFANKDNLKTFKKNPQRYVPAYNGFCAFGVSVGKKFLSDPEVYRVVNGKTYLNLDADIQDAWLEDTRGHIKSADKKWQKVKDQDLAS